jgi:16S rRNA (cytosine1402-N4)-methyltransferase
MAHVSVLLQEIIEGLNIQKSDVYFDGTINGGGHSEAVAKLLGKEGMIVGTDLDANALAKARVRLEGVEPKVVLIQSSFRNLDKVLDVSGAGRVDKILLDLGLSSNQFDESNRGFTFQKDEPLLMTFNNNPGEDDLTAWKIVNNWDEGNIAQIIESYGEERFAKRIARAIVETRAMGEIRTTNQLVEIIKNCLPKIVLHKKIHPATKTFQALRITVNDELGSLKEALEKGMEKLSSGGRFAIISFHSLEDRIVKVYFKKMAEEGRGKILTKRPIVATDDEISSNPRSRSAKLRIIEKI